MSRCERPMMLLCITLVVWWLVVVALAISLKAQLQYNLVRGNNTLYASAHSGGYLASSWTVQKVDANGNLVIWATPSNPKGFYPRVVSGPTADRNYYLMGVTIPTDRVKAPAGQYQFRSKYKKPDGKWAWGWIVSGGRLGP